MTLLIRNVKIVGGDREFPGPVDVFVSGDTISAIGTFPNKAVDTVLDGQGAYLAPGFIDADSASDHYLTLFDDRGQEDFLRQGVTTIIGGMDGASLEPLAYGTLESLQKWGDPGRINVNWHTTAEFLDVLQRRPLGVNFGTLAGHATIRRALVGEALRELTKNELAVFGRSLREALDEGAFGLSVGLAAVHARHTPYGELADLAAIVAHAGGVYATDLRVAEDLAPEDSVKEVIRIAQEEGVRTFINHFMPADGMEAHYRAALATVNGLTDSVALRFGADPFAQALVPIYTFLPLWAQNGGIDVMRANIKDTWLLPRIRKDLALLDEDGFVIAHAPGNGFLVGKTLHAVREMYGLDDPRDALLKLMETTKMKGSVLHHGMNAPLARKALAGPRSLLGTHAPSFGDGNAHHWVKPESAASAFTTFLSLAAAGSLSPLDLRAAVRKITAEPAAFFELKKRGVIKEGNYADLTCFKIDPAAGTEVRFTVVNGAVAVEGSVFKERFSGKVLRHSA